MSMARKCQLASRQCLLQTLVSQVVLLEGPKEMEINGSHRTSGACDRLRHYLCELADHRPYIPHLATIKCTPSAQSRTKNLAGKELAIDTADTEQASYSRLDTLDLYSFHAGMQALVP
jgi:hypothetical protein